MAKEEGSIPPYGKIPSVEYYPAHFGRYLLISEVIAASEFPSLLITVITCCLVGASISNINRNKVLYCSLRDGWVLSCYVVLNGKPRLSIVLMQL